MIHLQRAQPVLAPHYWLAWCEKFQRDRGRLADCRRRVNVLTLGTAALAGTTLPIDREFVAEQLDFDGVSANSLDSSSDRDFVIEYVFTLSMIAEHLSSWAEECLRGLPRYCSGARSRMLSGVDGLVVRKEQSHDNDEFTDAGL